MNNRSIDVLNKRLIFEYEKKFDRPKIENVRKVENGSCKMKFDAH